MYFKNAPLEDQAAYIMGTVKNRANAAGNELPSPKIQLAMYHTIIRLIMAGESGKELYLMACQSNDFESFSEVLKCSAEESALLVKFTEWLKRKEGKSK